MAVRSKMDCFPVHLPLCRPRVLPDLGVLSLSEAPLLESVDWTDLGDVTLGKVFPVPLDFLRVIL